jgi:hypothetical protein
MTFAVAHHEAAHAVAGYALGLPVVYATVRPTEDRMGAVRHDPNVEVRPKHELDFAVVLVAGNQAERFALGREPWYRTNWFVDDPDSDEARATEWIAAEAERGGWDELECRALVQLRGRGLVFSNWRVIEALAEKLQRHTTVLGAEIERTCRELGAKQYGTKTIDPETRSSSVSVDGRQLSLREWSRALDQNAKDRQRAIRAIKGGKA